MKPNAERQLSVSVIVPVRDASTLSLCLESLKAQDRTPLEIIVVNDRAGLEINRVAAAFGARVIDLVVPGGAGRARNEGAAAAQGEVLLFVEPDYALPVSAVRELADKLVTSPEIAAVYASMDDAPLAENFASQFAGLVSHDRYQRLADESSVLRAHCLAMRREVFFIANGFNEENRGAEDIELGCRLHEGGYRLMLLKSVQVKRLRADMLATLLLRAFAGRAIPWTRLMLEHPRRLSADLAGLPRRISIALAGLLALQLLWVLDGHGEDVAVALALGFIAFNLPRFTLFARLRGPIFALRALPVLWLHDLACGAGAAYAWLLQMYENWFTTHPRDRYVIERFEAELA